MAMSATNQNPDKQKIMSKETAKTLLKHYTTPNNRIDDFWAIEKRRLIEACTFYRLEIPDWLTNK